MTAAIKTEDTPIGTKSLDPALIVHLQEMKKKYDKKRNDFEILQFNVAQAIEAFYSTNEDSVKEVFSEAEIDELLTWAQDWQQKKEAEVAVYRERFNLNTAVRQAKLEARAAKPNRHVPRKTKQRQQVTGK